MTQFHTQARCTATRHVIYAAGFTSACMGLVFLLVRAKPGLGWLAPFTVGFALVLYGLGGLLRSRRVRRWPVVRGTVTASTLREVLVPGRFGGYMEYLPEVHTQYSTDTGSFLTDRYGWVHGDFRGGRAATEALLAAYPVGAVVDVYVNPANPEIACLRPAPSRKRRSQYLACLSGGLIVMAIALWVYVQA